MYRFKLFDSNHSIDLLSICIATLIKLQNIDFFYNNTLIKKHLIAMFHKQITQSSSIGFKKIINMQPGPYKSIIKDGIKALQEQKKNYPRIVVLIEGSEESGSPDFGYYTEMLKDDIGNVQFSFSQQYLSYWWCP